MQMYDEKVNWKLNIEICESLMHAETSALWKINTKL